MILSIILAFCLVIGLPLLIGTGVLLQKIPLTGRWYVGLMGMGLFFSVFYAVHIPKKIVFAIFAVLVILCLWRTIRACLQQKLSIVWPSLPAFVAYGFVGVLLINAWLLVLVEPVSYADAVVIWFQKTTQINQWVDFKNIFWPNYPNLGPSLWMTALTLVDHQECFGRLFFPTAYIFFILELISIVPLRAKSWFFPLLTAAIGFRFFYGQVYSGYQDMFVMSTIGMAAIFFVRFIMQADKPRRKLKNERILFLTACFLAGSAAHIKSEGGFLALMTLGAVLVVVGYNAIVYRTKYSPVTIIAGISLLAAIISIHYVIVAVYGLDVANFQSGLFNVKESAGFFKNINRLPLITSYVLEWYGEYQKMIALSLITSALAIGLYRRAAGLIIFPWLVIVAHGCFLYFVFLNTAADVNWHLSTACFRLQSQLSAFFMIAFLLSLSICCRVFWVLLRKR